MTSNVLGLSVDTGAPALNVRAQATLISPAGVNDAAALARQQLTTAVPAPTLIAAYSANVPQQPKPPVRPTPTAPSSSLAAQFIAQEAVTSAEELAIFVSRAATVATNTPADDDFLATLRMARGDIPAPKNAAVLTAKPSQELAQATIQTQVAATTTATNAANETLARTVVAQAATGLPALFTQFIRKPTIINTRGLTAYQLAEARNAAMRKVPVPEEAAVT